MELDGGGAEYYSSYDVRLCHCLTFVLFVFLFFCFKIKKRYFGLKYGIIRKIEIGEV